jgi:hypothetical protein
MNNPSRRAGRLNILAKSFRSGSQTTLNHPENSPQDYRRKRERKKKTAGGEGQKNGGQSLHAECRESVLNGGSAMTGDPRDDPNHCDAAKRHGH